MKKKITAVLLLIAVFTVIFAAAADALSFKQAMARWSKERKFLDRDDGISNLTIRATYYSAEFIEAYILKEAEENLWTQQEADDYKYKFLQALRLDEMIPIQLEFSNNGETMHMGPFDIMCSLSIDGKTYKPADYDKRLNFRFQGKKEGLVFFARYDEKTGKDLLANAKRASLILRSSISPTMITGSDVRFMWEIGDDDPMKLYQGRTAARAETDRLLKRLEKLRSDKADEEQKLNGINDEIKTIQARIDELSQVQ